MRTINSWRGRASYVINFGDSCCTHDDVRHAGLHASYHGRLDFSWTSQRQSCAAAEISRILWVVGTTSMLAAMLVLAAPLASLGLAFPAACKAGNAQRNRLDTHRARKLRVDKTKPRSTRYCTKYSCWRKTQQWGLNMIRREQQKNNGIIQHCR
jgi:hypothetical protein